MLYWRRGIVGGLLAFLMLVVFCAGAKAEFLIAVAADGQNTSGQISQVAGRAPYFQIYNAKGGLLETVSNPYCTSDRGAGSKTANFLAEKEISLVIAGRFGRNMTTALDLIKIKHVEQKGNIIDGVGKVTYAE